MGLSHRTAGVTENTFSDVKGETQEGVKATSCSTLQEKASFKEWLQRKRSFTDLFEPEGFANLSKQWGSFKGKAGERLGFQKPSVVGKKAQNKNPLKGRAALQNVIVKEDRSIWNHFYDSYIYLLRLPAPLFTFYCMLAPFLAAVPFTFVYSLDPEGFIAHGTQGSGASLKYSSSKGSGSQLGTLNILFEIYLYSLSLSTTFGGSRLDARSPFCLLVANVNTLVAQLMFVFLSGAVFSRLSQPSQPVKISSLAIITDDIFDGEGSGSEDGSAGGKYKILMTRLVLTGPGANLIDAKIDLVYRHMVQLPEGSPFMSTDSLKLVRSDASCLRYGMLVRHVINEDSPLFGACDREQLLEEDANFQLTVMATEKSSMQPVFADQMFFVADAEVLWDAQFVDIISVSKGRRIMEHRKLNAYKKDGKVVHHVGGK